MQAGMSGRTCSLHRSGKWTSACPYAVQRAPARQHRGLAQLKSASVAPSANLQAEDSWVAANIVPLVQQAPTQRLQQLQDVAASALRSLRMPSTRNEEYRFTDLKPLLRCSLKAAPSDASISREWLSGLMFAEAQHSTVVLVNGQFRPDLSSLSGLPEGVFLGSIQGAQAAAVESLGAQSNTRGGPFAVLNGAAARDALCLLLPDKAHVSSPIHVLYVATGTPSGSGGGGGSGGADGEGAAAADELACSAPRLLVVAGAGSSAEIVEEFVSGEGAGGRHFTCAVAEVVLAEGAQVKHGYLQAEGASAVHVKSSLVQQADSSSYSLTEVSLGGSLSRHDLGIQQLGGETSTSMRHFLLCGPDQLHDLHSKLQLDFPHGQAEQLHKCIAAAPTAKGVFDGNVQVNRPAQKTDAQQLSRNLLLAPRATVNVKPNLQIVADDVKCTHGCAVSDLSEEELFYFRARGIPANVARQALVYSFGSEVVQQLRHKQLTDRIQGLISQALTAALAQRTG